VKPYYQDSAVTIYHGDCMEIAPQLGRFDLLLTDPPYGIGKILHGGWSQRTRDTMYWDLKPVDIYPLIKLAKNAIVWGANYYQFRPSRGWLVWVKRNALPSMANVELAWTSFDKNSKYFDTTISSTNAERVQHPTQKPLALIKWCLLYAGDVHTILDPFAGSGTTGRAAKDLNKTAVLIEKEERYCEIAALRMSQEVLPLFRKKKTKK